MGAPSVPYKMLTEGFEITSDENGFRAAASFKVLWVDAFTFHDEIKGISSSPPWKFPGSSSSSLYASQVRIGGLALDDEGNARPISAALGMAPGEFWTWVRVDVIFETPSFPYVSGDDGSGSNHLDPAGPLYGCEQSVRIGTRADSVTGKELANLVFDSDVAASPSEATVYKGESHLTLHWPYVPYVPWVKYKPFRNTLNDAAIFDCARGELLFQGADIQPAQGPFGSPGRSVTITLAVGEGDWNTLPHPETGVRGLVSYGGDTSKRLYAYKSYVGLAP